MAHWIEIRKIRADLGKVLNWKMGDEASLKLTSCLDSLPQAVNKSAAIAEISVVLSAVTPASLRAIVPNLSFNIVFECLASCSRCVIRQVISFVKHLQTVSRQDISGVLSMGLPEYRIWPHWTTSDHIGSHLTKYHIWPNLTKLSRDVCNGHAPPVNHALAHSPKCLTYMMLEENPVPRSGCPKR